VKAKRRLCGRCRPSTVRTRRRGGGPGLPVGRKPPARIGQSVAEKKRRFGWGAANKPIARKGVGGWRGEVEKPRLKRRYRPGGRKGKRKKRSLRKSFKKKGGKNRSASKRNTLTVTSKPEATE